MENKITIKTKKRYFRINDLFINIRILSRSPILFLILSSIVFPEYTLKHPWKVILISILVGFILSLAYICLRWWSDIDLDEKEKELKENFNRNEKIIKQLQQTIVSKEQPNTNDLKKIKKIKKITNTNDQILIGLRILDM
ncbi:MAG: hypothetical protein WC010_03890 [Candidatus Absconditabacterales bacterium]